MATFDYSPASLRTLAKTEREKLSTKVSMIVLDMEDGSVFVQKNSATHEIVYAANLDLDETSPIQWEKLVGTENLKVINALVQLRRSDLGGDLAGSVFTRPQMEQ
jgi:hypothetical protein